MDPGFTRIRDIVLVNFKGRVIAKNGSYATLQLLDEDGFTVQSPSDAPVQISVPYWALDSVVYRQPTEEEEYADAVKANAMLRQGMEELGQRIEEQSKIVAEFIAQGRGTTIDMEVLKRALVELNVLPKGNPRSSMFPINEPVELSTEMKNIIAENERLKETNRLVTANRAVDRERLAIEVSASREQVTKLGEELSACLEEIARLEADLRKSNEEAHSLKVLAFQIQDRALKAEAENEILHEKIHRFEELSGMSAPEPLSSMDIAAMRQADAEFQSRSRLNRPEGAVNVFEMRDLSEVAAVVEARKRHPSDLFHPSEFPVADMVDTTDITDIGDLGQENDSGSYVPRNY